jgi:diguanylate cyclase
VKEQDDRALQEKYRQEVESLQGNVTRLERELDEHREKARQARESSLHDPLTGCHNRLAYRERGAIEEARWRRYGSDLSVMVVDVDRFKAVNDAFGHNAGDQALKAIAQLAGRQLREVDFFGRWGGEEFVVLLPETPLNAALAVAEKVRRTIEAFRFHAHGKRVPVTISCGVAQLRDGDTLDSAFERADRALYAAKNGGRNCVRSEEQG